jgi:DNA-binding NarL/FixJ family response regulator
MGPSDAALTHDAAHRNGPQRTRIVLVENHVILRQGLKALLEMDPDVCVIGEVGTAAEALAVIDSLAPTVVIIDIALPGESGIDLIATLRERACAAPILVLTALHSKDLLRSAMRVGASGFLLKDSPHAKLLEALRAVSAGQRFFCETLSEEPLNSLAHGPKREDEDASVRMITRREREIIVCVALGQTSKSAARELGLSVKTVEKHRSNMMRKLDLHNSAAVTMFALRHGFVTSEKLAGVERRSARRS